MSKIEKNKIKKIHKTQKKVKIYYKQHKNNTKTTQKQHKKNLLMFGAIEIGIPLHHDIYAGEGALPIAALPVPR